MTIEDFVAASEWQLIGKQEWHFGIKLRGAVRAYIAFVYFDKEHLGCDGGWRWQTMRQVNKSIPNGGYAVNFSLAVRLCEEVLGITDQDHYRLAEC